MRNALARVVAAALVLAGCATSVRPLRLTPGAVAIVDATVINPRAGTVAEHMTVVVDNGVIVAIQPAAVPLSAGFRRVDGRGRYLIPGLWDAHVHLSKLGPNALALLVANGVTGVRDMGGNLAELAAWRANIAGGRLVGPRILISGPMLESQSNIDRMRQSGGVELVGRQRIGVASPEQGRAAVRELADAGVDQIKMRTTPDLETFAAVADEAHRRRLPFAAHAIATPDQMVAVGLDSVEHYVSMPPLALTNLDPEDRRMLFRRMAASGLHFSNTAANIAHLLTPREAGARVLDNAADHSDPLRRYVCGYLIEDWREQLEEAEGAHLEALSALLPAFYAELREMHDEGVPLLAGTDAAVMFVYPGFSMHEALSIMVNDAGLSPMETLNIATNGVAAYFDRESEWGGVEPGLSADLVLLDANPLESIANTRRISGVMARGVWFDRAALDELLRGVEADSGSRCLGGSQAGRVGVR